MSISPIIIYDQGNTPQCKEYSFLTAITILNPNINADEVLKAINENPAGMLTNRAAGEFFKARGYIKDYRKVPRLKVKALLNRNIPLIAGVKGVNWGITAKPPYIAQFEDRVGGHSCCVVGFDNQKRHLKVANTYGDKWGDNGFYYIHADDLKRVTEFYELII